MKISGGAKLEAALKDLSKKISSASKLRVGFMEGATYDDGTSVAMVAAIQNYGAPGRKIPPRPFFTTSIEQNSGDWPNTLKRALKDTDYDAKAALGVLGEEIVGQIKQAIIETNAPPLSPVTVMLRGMRHHDSSLVVSGATVGEAAQRVADGKTNYGASTKPLIDDGTMLNAVTPEVE